MEDKHIISIDLKSFFASVECVERGLDPFKTALVVADISRGNGAMSLAVSPFLRQMGIKSRSRVYEIPKNINIKYVQPRMRLYEEYSKKVINIYKEFFSDEDIHIYSIDEVFIDASKYLNYYKKSDIEIALMVMKCIKDRTNLTTTCGIGPNIFLSKVAMDIEAKHNKNCIAKWTYEDVKNKLWNIEPISEIWGFGKRTEKTLNNLGIKKIKDINKYSRTFYIKRFGNVMGDDIWSKANGIDYTTIKQLNSRKKDKSISMSQILNRDYNVDEAFLIIEEMNDLLNEKLRKMSCTTKALYLSISYSKIFYKSFHETVSLSIDEDNKNKILETFNYIYYKNIEDLPIRKVTIAYLNLSNKKYTQLSLFDKDVIESDEYCNIINLINDKFGRTSLLRASSLLKNSTIKNREKFKNMI